MQWFWCILILIQIHLQCIVAKTDMDPQFLGLRRKGATKGVLYTQEARAYGFKEKEIKGKKNLYIPKECTSLPPHLEFYSRFRRYPEINQKLEDITKAYPENTKLVNIGKSVEGRDIRGIVVYGLATQGKKVRNAVFAMGSIHGREWTTISGVMYSIETLLGAYKENQKWAKEFLHKVTLHAIPLVNPDGYEYTFSDSPPHMKEKWAKGKVVKESVEARYWRKNRGKNKDGSIGVDLNRNFGSKGEDIWGRDKSSKSISLTGADIYQGTQGFSEPESRAVKKYVMKTLTNRSKPSLLNKVPNIEGKGRITALYDVHCCIGAVLEPYSAFPMKPEQRQGVKSVGEAVANGLSKAGKGVTNYVEGSGVPGEYVWRPRDEKSYGSGITSSWSFQEARVNLTYVVEVRGKFVMPCWEIIPIAKEVLSGLLVLGKHAAVAEPYDWENPIPWPPVVYPSKEELNKVSLDETTSGNSSVVLVGIVLCVGVLFWQHRDPNSKFSQLVRSVKKQIDSKKANM